MSNSMHELYKKMYTENASSRVVNEGNSGLYIRFPEFVKFFTQRFQEESKDLDVLELGAGIGEMYALFQQAGLRFNSYTASEYSSESTRNLIDHGFKALQLDAMSMDLPNDSYDLVFCADVLHHVPNPEQMIKEMIRVSKRYVYLFEANGLSIIRKIGECSKSAKMLEEKSYTPRKIFEFFSNHGYKPEIKPFYFFVPPKLSMKRIKMFTRISHVGTGLPLLRWQSQSLEIFLDKKRREENDRFED